MSRKELRFRFNYFRYVASLWMKNGCIFCKTPLCWEISVDGERKEYHVGTFGEFVKWIIFHETFDNL